MRPALNPAILRAFRLLLPLVACSWTLADDAPSWSKGKELVHLYTFSISRSFHLQIYPSGNINGAPQQSMESAVVIKTDSRGYVRIVGVKSGLFLCMRRKGKLYGSPFLSEDCFFQYHRLKNHLYVFVSAKHYLLVSLGRYKGPFLPNVSLPEFSQFIVRKNKIPLSWLNTDDEPKIF